MTGGEAYEALNNASHLTSNLIIILNDNDMSISPSVGGFSHYLSDIRTSDGYIQLRDKIHDSLNESVPGVVKGISRAKQSLKSLMVPGMFFEEMGIIYLGPIDGHNVKHMVKAIEAAKRVNKAVLIHVCTRKGKGYLSRGKETRYPDRFFDVGIAEQHAVTFAAGLALGGLKPVVAVYSTFLQRAYDQILEDVCLQQLPVVFAVDRGGLVGSDGETHQGIFDLSYLSSVPGMTVMAPKNGQELEEMMRFALSLGKPAAVRYPRGSAYSGLSEFNAPIEEGRAEMIYDEGGVLLLAAGSMVRTAMKVRRILKERGIACSLANARFVKRLDTELLANTAGRYSMVVTMEENVKSGGFGEHVAAWYAESGLPVKLLQVAIPDTFVTHGSPQELYRLTGIDAQSVVSRILEKIGD